MGERRTSYTNIHLHQKNKMFLFLCCSCCTFVWLTRLQQAGLHGSGTPTVTAHATTRANLLILPYMHMSEAKTQEDRQLAVEAPCFPNPCPSRQPMVYIEYPEDQIFSDDKITVVLLEPEHESSKSYSMPHFGDTTSSTLSIATFISMFFMV